MRTVRFRLTVWYSSLLLVFGLAFVISLNIAARVDQPDDLLILRGLRVGDIEWQPVRSSPGGALAGFTPVVTPSLLVEEAGDEFQSQNLDRLRNWSIIAVIGLAVTAGLGGYALSGMMLRPVRDITGVASEISATNLTRRINHEGPDDELKALADTFDSMIDRIEGGFESQRRFVQDASHELRTPLAAIRTNIEVTELDDEASNEDYKALMETVKGQTERLTRLSEDLLLLTTQQAEALPLESVDLGSLIAMVSEELGPLAHRAGVTLVASGDLRSEAIASPDLLYRCIFNLVDNAVKHSDEGSDVVVDVSIAAGSPSVQVTDTGQGIPADELGHVFERFYRVDKGRARRHGGSGLGLAIVRELMEAMGGSVQVESVIDEGSTFTLQLRRAAGTNGSRPASQRLAGS